MTFGFVSLIIAFGTSFIVAMGLFMYVNRNAASALDAVEDSMRKK